jgi:hypothetical protein
MKKRKKEIKLITSKIFVMKSKYIDTLTLIAALSCGGRRRNKKTA